VGGKYSDSWQVQHLIDPRSLVPESIMPTYALLMKNELNLLDIKLRLQALQSLGVPYTDTMIAQAYNDAIAQQMPDSENVDKLKSRYGDNVIAHDFDGKNDAMPSEMDALVAYLQVLGTMVDVSNYNVDKAPETVATPAKEAR
jgi:cytochrome c oxidase cbb3-type subunit 2